jgi:hypothetical protein
MSTFPRLVQVVLDTTDARALAEFYREFLGYRYRPGDEQPPPGTDDERGRDWLVLLGPDGARAMAFQQVEQLTPTTWPDDEVPQQLHLDIVVPDKPELDRHHQRALDLGATLRYDRSAHPHEPLRVYADPAGHTFCVFVGHPLPRRRRRNRVLAAPRRRRRFPPFPRHGRPDPGEMLAGRRPAESQTGQGKACQGWSGGRRWAILRTK